MSDRGSLRTWYPRLFGDHGKSALVANVRYCSTWGDENAGLVTLTEQWWYGLVCSDTGALTLSGHESKVLEGGERIPCSEELSRVEPFERLERLCVRSVLSGG